MVSAKEHISLLGKSGRRREKIELNDN
jgi:hypothetical protein